MQKTAVSYRRVSSGKQLRGHGLARQREMSIAWCATHNLLLVDDLVDNGLSAFKGHHKHKGEFGPLLHAVQTGTVKFDCLLVENFDRIGRMPVMEQFSQFSLLINAGIELHIISENRIFTSESINSNPYELFGVLAQMARSYDESRLKAQRIKQAYDKKLQALQEHGVIFSKTVPFWLDVNHDRTAFSLNKHVLTVKRCFDLAVQGHGATKISRLLNDEKVPVPEHGARKCIQAWTRNKVQRVLTNPAVYGRFVGKKTQVDREDYYPDVISKQIFHQVQSMISTRNAVNPKTSNKQVSNLFSGLMFCECGRTMKLYNFAGGDFFSKRTFKCRSSSEDGHCEHKTVYWLKSFEIQALILLYELNCSNKPSKPSQAPIIEQQIRELEASNANLVKLIMQGQVSQAIANASMQLELEIQQAKKQLEATKLAEATPDTQLDQSERDATIQAVLYDEQYQARLLMQSQVQQLIKQVTFYKHGVLFELKSGIQYWLRPLTNRDFSSVYSLRVPDGLCIEQLHTIVPQTPITVDTSKRQSAASNVPIFSV
ncbi:recombinase family protein [Vibrio cholerae]|uniref:recombinase family protein n=1 Tax=Vibrio cholerae TaxID=666 RepID=UPI003530A90F